MLRKDFYFRELVTESEINSAFDGSENADQNFAVDNDLAQKADNTGTPFSTPDTPDFNALLGGITKGLTCTVSGLTVTVAPGTAYDYLGRRINVASAQTIDISVTGDTAIGGGGVPIGGVSTGGIPSTNFRSILLQVYFNRLLSDPRTDGNNNTVYFNSAESYQFRVKASNPSVSPSIPGGDPNCVILGSFLRNDSNVISSTDFSTRGDWIRTYAVYSGSSLPTAQTETSSLSDGNFIRGTPRQAVIKLRNAINLGSVNYANHINQSAPQDRHAAKNIDFTATIAGWADGSGGLPSILGGGTVGFGLQSTIETIVSLLSDTTPGAGGTKKIGGASLTGSPTTVASGTLRSQLQAILDAFNTHLNASTMAHQALAIQYSPDGTFLTYTDVQDALNQLVTITPKLGFDNTFIGASYSSNSSVPNTVIYDSSATGGSKAGWGVQGQFPTHVINTSAYLGAGMVGSGNGFLSVNARPADPTHWQLDNSSNPGALITFGDSYLLIARYASTSPFLTTSWSNQVALVPNNTFFANLWRQACWPQGVAKVGGYTLNASGVVTTFNCGITNPTSTSGRVSWGINFTFPDTHYVPIFNITFGGVSGYYVSISNITTTSVDFTVYDNTNTAVNLTTTTIGVAFLIYYV